MRTRPAWGLITLLACGTASPENMQVHAPVVRTPAPALPPAKPASPIDQLAARGVYHDDFARGVLYSWTTPTQVGALRDSRRLLVADASVGTPSPFLRELTEVALGEGPGQQMAKILLEDPQLRRRRYAWPSPYATTMGLGPVRYGDALIRIDLDPRSIVLRFVPGDREPLIAVDMHGAAVALADVDPGRIAAVYHVRDGPAEEVAFREYVVCNESMVLAWSVATPEIRAQIDAEISLLEWLAAGPLAVLPEAAQRASAAPAWQRARPGAPAIDLWHASLAFDNLRYRPSRQNLAAIAAALRGYVGGGAPLTQRQTTQLSQASR